MPVGTWMHLRGHVQLDYPTAERERRVPFHVDPDLAGVCRDQSTSPVTQGRIPDVLVPEYAKASECFIQMSVGPGVHSRYVQ